MKIVARGATLLLTTLFLAQAAIAEGYRHAIDLFGPESAWYAWHSPANTSIPRYDVRNKECGLALPYGTSHNNGGMGRMGVALGDDLKCEGHTA